ncbi:MAG: hypothetical protein GY868_02225 [Deltaproteobacteria bacterium]|nr:hypothetical protein [Deltaproteobacteria bacterium]
MRLFIATGLFYFTLNLCSAAHAIQVTGCHCFKNRNFDVAQPGAVDPYLLATTQNSFLAAIFRIDKKQIVQAKMGGVSGDDLWTAHFAASKTGTNAKKLLAFRKASGSWKKVLEQNKIKFKSIKPHFKEALARDISDKGLSSMIVDQMIIDYLGAEKFEVARLREAGAQNKEIILSAFLARRTKRSAAGFYSAVTSGQSTWGKILNDLKIEAKEMGTEVNKILAH